VEREREKASTHACVYAFISVCTCVCTVFVCMCMYVCTCACFDSHMHTCYKDFFGLYVMLNVSKETYVYEKSPYETYIKINHIYTCDKDFFGLFLCCICVYLYMYSFILQQHMSHQTSLSPTPSLPTILTLKQTLAQACRDGLFEALTQHLYSMLEIRIATYE